MKISANVLMLLPVLLVFPTATLAAEPVAQNTVLTMGFDVALVPEKVVVWDKLSGGHDEKDPNKWARNSLVCQSRTDSKHGACPTFPVRLSAILRPTKVKLDFTLEGTSTVVAIVIEGRKTGVYCTSNGSAEGYICPDVKFTMSIPQEELKQLNRAGRWTATLKQDLMQWPDGDCTGSMNEPSVGCTNATKLNTWSADITFNVTDETNQQI
ncbi:CfaE/CblD family pilus tip adhesin, partial [Serratia sp. 2723]|uniref:CfaE/CblD family pilus tip adhesin n=1 Tax=unclassified Serratia (in: enterobacteria) TaxID=2647522 RepID=UPI003D1E0D76